MVLFRVSHNNSQLCIFNPHLASVHALFTSLLLAVELTRSDGNICYTWWETSILHSLHLWPRKAGAEKVEKQLSSEKPEFLRHQIQGKGKYVLDERKKENLLTLSLSRGAAKSSWSEERHEWGELAMHEASAYFREWAEALVSSALWLALDGLC